MKKRLARLSCLAALMMPIYTFAADDGGLQQTFTQPPDNARIMVRWWWYGPAVTKPMIRHELETMKAGGFGGVEVQPTYPLSVDGELPGVHNIKFMSPEFLDMLNYTAATAKELGLRMDLTLGSGWPYGGPMFSRAEGAGAIQAPVVVRPAAGAKSAKLTRALQEGQSVIAALAVPTGAKVNPADIKVLTVDGITAQIPDGLTAPFDVRFYIAGQTGMQVKRPAMGAEGPVIDHLSETVVQKFIKEIAEPEIAACGDNPPHAIFCDSLEVAGESWTDNLPAEFLKRRGYDIKPLLPALFDDNFPKAMDIRHDWGQTLTECFNDNFNKQFKALAHAHGTLFREQAYGSPSAGQFSYIDTDLPEGEQYTWHAYSATRYASSAAHLLGVPVSSSETFTWLHSPVFRAVPLDMKAEADLHFLEGVTQIICHGWPSTAPGASYPGWSFYASAVFNDKNPWWIVMPDVTKYLQRTSATLRQGKPANDVAVYLADSDGWAAFTSRNISLTSLTGGFLGNVVGDVLDAGYNLDFFDDGMLDHIGKVDGGALAFGELKYKVVVLSGVERIPLSTMRKLETFAKNGGTVVALYNLPSLAPGYLTSAEDNQEVRDIAKRLFTDPGALGVLVTNDADFAAAVHKHLAPDMSVSPANVDISAVHRHTDSGEVYFVANTSNESKAIKATFRVEGLNAEQWDPMNGQTAPLAVIDRPAGGETVSLNLPPYGSTFVVWSNRSAAAPAAVAAGTAPAAIDLSDNWTVTFGADGKPAPMEKLKSWTDDAATKAFSGTATYTKSVTITADMLKPGVELTLSLGEGKSLANGRGGRGGARMQAYIDPPVKEAAVVYINDQRLGSIWHPPYTLDLKGALKEGENQIRIEVANTAVNYISGHAFPNYNLQAIRAAFGNRFDPQDIQSLRQPLPSGLMGPIKIVAKGAGN